MKSKWTLIYILLIPFFILTILNLFVFKLNWSESLDISLWYYFITMMGLLFFPITKEIFYNHQDGGYGSSKIIAIVTLFYLNWILTQVGLLEFNSKSLFFCLIFTLVVSHILSRKSNELVYIFKKYKKNIIYNELLFFIIFAIYLTLNSFHSHLPWGEKPMDYNILHFLNRTTSLPLTDPWFSGRVMNYYYFGYYIFAGLIKITGVDIALGYALSMSTCAAFFASSLYSIFNFFLRVEKDSFYSAIILTFSSTFGAILIFFKNNFKVDLTFFWNITRIFDNHYFAEFPSWSFLFMDLHPHVMSYSLSIVFLLFCLSFLSNNSKPKKIFIIMMALHWGVLAASNAWDFIIYSLCFLILIIFSIFNKSFNKIKVLNVILISLSVGILYSPMFMILSTGKRIVFKISESLKGGIYGHFFFYGHWVMIILITIGMFLVLQKRKSLNILNDVRSYLGQMLIISFLLIFVAEKIIFMDAMNTFFKFMNQVYILLGIIAITLYFRYKRVHGDVSSEVIYKIPNFLLMLTMIGFIFQVYAINKEATLRTNGSNLKTGESVRLSSSNVFKLIQWINKHIEGTPSVVEGHSKSFNLNSSRISTYTGLPSYLGWDNHVFIRGAKRSEIFRRQRDIDFIYQTVDALKAHELLIQSNIHFLIIGPYEKIKYRGKGILKFNQYSDLFTPIKTYGSISLYGIGDFQKHLIY